MVREGKLNPLNIFKNLKRGSSETMDNDRASLASSQRNMGSASPSQQAKGEEEPPLPVAPGNQPRTDNGVINGAISAKPRYHFAEHFWGENDRGLDVLVARMKAAKHTTEDIISMLQTRASIEEDYAKKLMKLHKQVLGKSETGTMKQCLDVIHQEIENTAKAHATVAADLKTEAEKPFQEFLNAQLVRRRAQQANAERALKAKVLQQVQVQKTKEKYEQKFIDNQNLLATANSGNTKEADKARSKLEKGTQQMKLADIEYKRAVDTLHELTSKWEDDFTACCEECEALEYSRLEQTRAFMWTYTNIISVGCVAVDESSERARVALEQCNVASDLEEFCNTLGTGKEKPKPQQYVKLGQQGGGRDSNLSSLSSVQNIPAASNSSLAASSTAPIGLLGTSQPNRLSANSFVQPVQNGMGNLSLSGGNGYPVVSQPLQPQASLAQSTLAVASAAPAAINGATRVAVEEEEEFEEYDIWDISDSTPILFKVRVLYHYAAQAPEELTITPGEILDITAQQNDGWWESIQWVPDPLTNGQTKKRRKGLLPSNFVEVYAA